MKYTDEQRIEKILLYAERLVQYAKETHLDHDRLENDYSVQWTVTTPLYNIGEHAYNISRECKESLPKIQWSLISGMRHRLVHDYDSTNWEIIYDIIFQELPLLIVQLQAVVNGSESFI